jgi:ankyrin repeat protein
VEALLDFGAAINGLEDDGSPLMTALSAGYLEAAEALTRKGARIDNIVAAAALGLVDLVDKFLNNEKEVKQGQALVSASTFGQTQTVAFMLDRGVEAGSLDRDDMTGLHWATARGHMDVVRLLLDRGAPLEVKNKWGGTVLGSTVFFAHSNPMAQVDFVTVIETLLSAGAQVSAAKYPTGLATVDAVLHRYRDAAE